MKLIRGLDRWTSTEPCALTIGNFDGVHLGHQAMLQQLVTFARENHMPACVISFEPLPHEYFLAAQAEVDVPARLSGFRDRVQDIAALDIDRLLILDFDDTQASQSADAFIGDVLVDKLNAKHVLVGDDFRFGHKREGDYALLQAHEKKRFFTLGRYNTVTKDGERVSSTRVRKLLDDAQLGKVSELLGHRYRISGRVVHGEKVGRQLGFPTANIALKKYRPPIRGVFAVVAHDQNTGKAYAAVANLGERPTVGGRKLLLEVHLLDTSAELYGHHLQIEFVEFIRGEQKFDSLEALKTAISNDSDTASSILNSNPEFTSLANRIH